MDDEERKSERRPLNPKTSRRSYVSNEYEDREHLNQKPQRDEHLSDDEVIAAKLAKQYSSHFRIPKIILLVMLCLNFVLAVTMFFTSSDLMGTKSGINDYEGGSGVGQDGTPGIGLLAVSSYRMIFSLIAMALSITAIGLAAPNFSVGGTTLRLHGIILIEAVCGFFDLSSLGYPSSLRMAITDTNVGLRVLIVSVVLGLLYSIRKQRRHNKDRVLAPQLIDELKSIAASEENSEEKLDQTMNCIKDLDVWLILKACRRSIRKKFWNGQRIIFVSSMLTLLLFYGRWFAEFDKIASTQTPFYDHVSIDVMNNQTFIESYFGPVRTSAANKVILVVLDGLRYDYTEKNEAFADFLSNETIAVDSKVYEITAQLPSMSVPNWISIITGAPPESTGVLGNLNVPEIKYDSIFREAMNFQINRGLTGSPWFADIVMSTLPFLKGDGTIATTVNEENSHSADAADYLRWGVLKGVMTLPTEEQYPLFLAHFSDIDIQGHCCGVTKEWNKDDTYNGAIVNKTRILHEIIDTIDEETVLWIVADHGHVDRGGHGGVSEVLRSVPLVIYKKGSSFRDRTFGGAKFDPLATKNNNTYTNLDIATTISAQLGLPVPRQNRGRFIDEAMYFVDNSTLRLHYIDLFIQKQVMVARFLKTVGSSDDSPLLKSGYVNNFENSTSLQPYVDGITAMLEILEKHRSSAYHTEMVRNSLLCFLVVLFLGVLVVFAIQVYSFADLSFIVPLYKSRNLGGHLNRRAFLISFLLLFVFFAVTIAVYLGLYYIYGYPYSIWDSTVIHDPQVIPIYLIFSWGPGIICSIILIRSYHVKYTIWPKKIAVSRPRFYLSLLQAILGISVEYSDIGMVYLIRVYTLFISMLFCWITILISSMYTFVIPGLFAIDFVTEINWKYRFQLLTVQLIILPWMLANIILVFWWPKTALTRTKMDRIYLLKIWKDYNTINDYNYSTFKEDETRREFGNMKHPFDIVKRAISSQAGPTGPTYSPKYYGENNEESSVQLESPKNLSRRS
eukprot:TRINITY_DN2016_c0_g1_i2.p1 TRINITY_DN2016_c0_g1~~TRINITY_DN2016_c0_g1_i2.p1  ORF type:complete len:1015 (-),score=212.19 TRINITY_DN2016_c0_g1_i2:78-3122(-)